MQGIFDGIQNLTTALQSIINGISIGISFLVGLVTDIFELVKLLATTIINTTTIITTLPSWLSAFGIASVGIAVLYMILGRDTGK